MSRDASEPHKYRQIADDLRTAIDAGTYQPGDRIPGENVIMATYDVARMTARQALAVLQAEGLTATRRGVGVFVRDFRPVIRNGVARLAEDRWTKGHGQWDADDDTRAVTVDQVAITRGPASDSVGALLALEPGAPVLSRTRRYLLDGRPVLRATSHLPADLVAGSPIEQEDTGPGGIYARLADLGHPPARFREDVRARMATPEEAKALDLDGSLPVLHVIRVAALADGTPVEVNDMTFDAGVYVLRYDFEA